MLFYNYVLKCRSNIERSYNIDEIERLNNRSFMKYVLNEDKVHYITNRSCNDNTLTVYAAADVNTCRVGGLKDSIIKSFVDCSIVSCHEVTVDEIKRGLEMSDFGSGRKLLTKLKLDYRSGGLFDPYPYNWSGQVINLPKLSKAECERRADKILASQSLKEELERIYSDKNKKEYYGHPVHYFVSAGDWGAAQDIYELILSALYSNSRLISNRLSVFRNFKKGAYRDERYRQHIAVSQDGIIIIELNSDSGTGRFASDFYEFTKVTGEILDEMKKDTLFIFVEIMGKSIKNSDAVSSIVSKADIIQLTEGSGKYEAASKYLNDLVSKSDIKADDPNEALDYLPKHESYTVSDIYRAYNSWYGSGLKNHIYKAYKKEDCLTVEITETDNKPYEELREMIGLSDAKTVVDQIVSAGKVRCMREKMGLKSEASSLNMLFAGNPGTAKTTVARLLAQILKEEDVIKSGRLVECGRQDLVGKYVGWTAKIIEGKFREAEGGVLFIDEAYSLVDGSNTYGAEAINTITQLMENYRDSVIVIFAGYPDKMRTFLEQNEGLRSRIAFHLNFPDYTADELLDILKLHTDKREYTLSAEAVPVCREILAGAVGVENFGNGRYVRNLLEQAVIRQSSRLLAEFADKEFTSEDMCLLKPEDFEAVVLGVKDQNNIRLGFAV